MKKTTTLLLVLLASAPLSAGDVPGVLQDAHHLNASRRSRVNAEIALQATIVAAKQKLFEEGHAAPLEVDTARLPLAELRCMGKAVARYQRLIDELVSVCQRDASHALAEKYPDMTHSPNAVAEVSARIAEKQAHARGRRGALEAEARYLNELLNRLRQAHDGSAAAGREIALAQLRLDVVKGRKSMEESQRRFAATVEQLHLAEHQLASPIQVAEGNVANLRQLAAILQIAWDLHRATAQRDALAARIELRRKYQGRIAELERDHSERPGEAHRQEWAIAEETRQLRSFDRRTAELKSNLDAYFLGHTPPLSRITLGLATDRNLADGRAALGAAIARRRVASLTDLNAEDSFFENELQRAKLELAVAEARAERDRRQTQLAAAARAARDTDVMLIDFNSVHEAEIKLIDRRMALLNWKISNLAALRLPGYATWKEVAIAERDLAIAEAERQSITEAHEIAVLRLERTRLAGQDSAKRITIANHKSAAPPELKRTTPAP